MYPVPNLLPQYPLNECPDLGEQFSKTRSGVFMKVVHLAPPVAIQDQPGNCRKFRSAELRHSRDLRFRKTDRITDPHRQIENRLRQFVESSQHGSASRQNHPGASLSFITGVTNFISNKMNDFFGSRLKDVAENLLADRTRLARPHADHFENSFVVGPCSERAALLVLQALGFGNR